MQDCYTGFCQIVLYLTEPFLVHSGSSAIHSILWKTKLGGELKPPYTLDDYEDEEADEPDDTYTLEKMMEEVDAAD